MALSRTSITAFLLSLRAITFGTFSAVVNYFCVVPVVVVVELGLIAVSFSEALRDWNVSRLCDYIFASFGRIRQAWHWPNVSGFQDASQPEGKLRRQRTYALERVVE